MGAGEYHTTMLYSTSSIHVQVEEARMEILRWVGVRNEGGFNLHVSSFTLMSTQKSRVYRPHLTRRHPQSPPLRHPTASVPKMPSPTHLPTTAYRANATLSKVDAGVDPRERAHLQHV